MAQVAPDSPIDDAFGALDAKVDEATPDIPDGVCLYVRQPHTIANDHEILKGAPFVLHPSANALCQKMANEVHKDVLPGHSHATAMEAIKDKFGLRMSSTTAPGLLKVIFEAAACREMRIQRQLSRLGTAHGQKKKPNNEDEIRDHEGEKG